jgi:hypothetical protein
MAASPHATAAGDGPRIDKSAPWHLAIHELGVLGERNDIKLSRACNLLTRYAFGLAPDKATWMRQGQANSNNTNLDARPWPQLLRVAIRTSGGLIFP